MTTYIIRRILMALVVLVIITLVVFFVMRLLPGDPLVIYLADSVNLEAMSQTQLDMLRHQYGLDQPLMVQYLNWVKGLVRGDFGESIFYHSGVGKLMGQRFPVTVHLGVLALIFGATTGAFVGLMAAIRRGTWVDKVITPLTYLGVTVPIFWLGILLIYAFGLKLHWLPISGYTSPFDNFWLSMRQSVMPIFCLSVFSLAANARQMRSAMLEVIRQDYIRTAWSKGLSERMVILKHALKNSLIPVITLIGMGVGLVFGGSVLVERVFAVPGIGQLMVNSIFAQDYVVVQAISFVIACIVLTVNMLVDISYGWFDPRIRYG